MLFIVTFVTANDLKAQELLSGRNDTVLVNIKSDSVHGQLPFIEYRNKNGRKLSYKTIPLSRPKLKHLINEYPVADKRKLLMTNYRKMGRVHNLHVASSIVGLGFACVFSFTGLMSSGGVFKDDVFFPTLAVSGIGLAATIPLSIISKRSYLKKRRQLVTLYNTSLP